MLKQLWMSVLPMYMVFIPTLPMMDIYGQLESWLEKINFITFLTHSNGYGTSKKVLVAQVPLLLHSPL